MAEILFCRVDKGMVVYILLFQIDIAVTALPGMISLILAKSHNKLFERKHELVTGNIHNLRADQRVRRALILASRPTAHGLTRSKLVSAG